MAAELVERVLCKLPIWSNPYEKAFEPCSRLHLEGEHGMPRQNQCGDVGETSRHATRKARTTAVLLPQYFRTQDGAASGVYTFARSPDKHHQSQTTAQDLYGKSAPPCA